MKRFFFYLFLTVLVYFPALKLGFFQDDFFHLTLSQASSIQEFIRFFEFRPDLWAFYRPLSTQLWYWIFTNKLSFMQASIPMHIAAFFLHSFCAYLVSDLSKKVFRLTSRASLIVGALYTIANLHFLSLFYIGATQQILATLFTLLAIKTSLSGKNIQSNLYFILALLSKEISIRFVPILIIIKIINGQNWRSALKSSSYPIIITISYLMLRIVSGIISPSEYVMNFSLHSTIFTTMWYGMFSFGIPEHMLHYGLASAWLTFFHDQGSAAFRTFAAAIFSFIILLISKRPKHFVFLALLWFISLLPIIFFPTHRYPHYLDLSLIAILVWVYSPKNNRNLKILFTISFTLANFYGHIIDKRTHWAVFRAELVDSYVKEIVSSGVCDKQKLVFSGSEKNLRETSYVLMNEHGPRHICNNPRLEVYYGTDLLKEDADQVVIKLK